MIWRAVEDDDMRPKMKRLAGKLAPPALIVKIGTISKKPDAGGASRSFRNQTTSHASVAVRTEDLKISRVHLPGFFPE
jgi:hypothetical protein